MQHAYVCVHAIAHATDRTTHVDELPKRSATHWQLSLRSDRRSRLQVLLLLLLLLLVLLLFDHRECLRPAERLGIGPTTAR